MHTVDVLETALAFAREAGYRVRHEWLGGNGGGTCQIRGQKTLFVDLAQAPDEQLDQVLDALGTDPAVQTAPIPEALRGLIDLRRSA